MFRTSNLGRLRALLIQSWALRAFYFKVESGQMEFELHVAFLFEKKSKMVFKSFKKFGTKILDIGNNEIY
jgi:hypothetical protein